MAAFCLPPKFADDFKKAVDDGKIDPAALAQLATPARQAFFETIVGPDNAKDVNTLFESKLALKNQKLGMKNWVKQLSGITEPQRADLATKIDKLSSVLQPADEDSFLADYASKKIGADVTFEQAKQIADLAKAVTDARAAPTTEASGISSEEINAETALHHYVNSLMPEKAWEAISHDVLTTGRNVMLSNLSTPEKTLIGQTENHFLDMITRRIGLLTGLGQANEFTSVANKQAWAQFRATGRDVSSAENGVLGEKNNFGPREGLLSANPLVRGVEAVTRTAANLSTKLVIDYMHNYSFVKFRQKSFFDMLNIMSTKLAKNEGLTGAALKQRATEIATDGARIQPQTDVGRLARGESQKQSARVASVNKNFVAELALGTKNLLNRWLPGAGDAVIPIAKIPATLLYNAVENATFGPIHGSYDLVKGLQRMGSLDDAEKLSGLAQMGSGLQRIGRFVGMFALGSWIASTLTPDDFKTDSYGNHYVKVAGYWINTEYFNMVSGVVAGLMEDKKTSYEGEGFDEHVAQYFHGVAEPLKHLPGIDEVEKLAGTIAQSNLAKGIVKYGVDFVKDRYDPPIIQNVFKDRPISRIFFGAHGVETEDEANQDTLATKGNRVESRLSTAKLGLDVFGQPVGFIDQATGANYNENDPVDKALKEIGYNIGFPPNKILGGVPLNTEQYRYFIQVAGQQTRLHLEDVVNDPMWDELNPKQKKQAVENAVKMGRKDGIADLTTQDSAVAAPGDSLLDKANLLQEEANGEAQ